MYPSPANAADIAVWRRPRAPACAAARARRLPYAGAPEWGMAPLANCATARATSDGANIPDARYNRWRAAKLPITARPRPDPGPA